MTRLALFFALAFSLLISAVAAQDEIQILVPSTTSTLRVDMPGFTFAPTVLGASGARVFTLQAGSLPPGVELNGNTGVIAGTPTRTGDFHGIVTGVKDGSDRQMALTPILTVRVIPLPAATYQDAVVQLGVRATLPPVLDTVAGTPLFNLAAGSLPLGLSINRNTGVITGTPRAAGVASGLRVRVTDSDGAASTSAPFSIEVSTAPIAPPPAGPGFEPPPVPEAEPKFIMRFAVP